MEAFKLPFAAVWVEPLWFTAQILLILLAGYLTQRFVAKGLTRLGERYPFPPQLLMPLRGVFRWIVIAVAVLAILERLGMSATVLWTAFTGFATVGAVAFFAAWSVLSNLFCAVLIVTVGPFRLGDHIELLDTAEKPGAKGRVIDLNMLYITLQDDHAPPGQPNLLQIPNSLIFQRVIRRWKGGLPVTSAHSPASPQEEAQAIAIATPDAGQAANAGKA